MHSTGTRTSSSLTGCLNTYMPKYRVTFIIENSIYMHVSNAEYFLQKKRKLTNKNIIKVKTCRKKFEADLLALNRIQNYKKWITFSTEK